VTGMGDREEALPSPGRGEEAVYGKIQHWGQRSLKEPTPKLTPNEREVLDALARGDVVVDIAKRWDTSPTMVYNTIASARRKLGARTNCQVVSLWTMRRRGR